LRKIAKKKKPVILSTGMYDMDDVRDAVNIFLDEGNTNLILLHCITCYPPVPEDINLKVINTLQKEFGCPVGYSDHTIGNDMVLAAVAVGASVIEKHIAVSKNAPGSQDCPVSCDERDLIEMVNSIRKIDKALGTGIKTPSEKELKSKEWARKSIVAKVDIKRGDVITEDMLTLKRPGTGISPEDISKVIGRRTKRNIKIDSLLQFDDLQ
ncbi:MAG: N-acetylneuraminate synthase family protein, partial [Thermodesulfovibrionales bacterium]|nr:N-acetylneuraminate synthase family protein [Thermodesulfovibrionales bacterium]